MNEPRFWLDGDAPPEVQRLLSLGEAPRPFDDDARERSRRRVLALSSVPMAAGVLFWVQNLALGALLGGVVSVGVAATSGVFSSPQASPGPAPSAVIRSAPPLAVSAPPAPGPALVPEPLAVERPRTTAPLGASAPASPPVATDGGVEAEARLLEAARRALAGDPSRALALLERHEREFPSGVLTTEREFLAIDALVRQGRRGDAEARAARLQQRVPGNLYEDRIQRILGKGE